MPTTTQDQVCSLSNPALTLIVSFRHKNDTDHIPVLTMMVSNAVLGGIADTVAQTITAVRQRSLRKNPGTPTGRGDGLAYELDRKDPFTERDLIPESKALPPPFDFERLTRFMAYGFGMAPLQFKWFRFLERIFPITKTSAFAPAMKRVAFDQLIFAPFGTFGTRYLEDLILPYPRNNALLMGLQVLLASSPS